MNKQDCGWIKIKGQHYITSCGFNTEWHRFYVFCPYCGNYIHKSRAWDNPRAGKRRKKEAADGNEE